MITPEVLKSILLQCKDPVTWAKALNETLYKYSIVTNQQIAMFIAQTGHESAHYNVVKENLNYSTDGLRTVFKRYFPNDAFAGTYARQPEKIANRVYANRMGNDNEASGDGWLYRGRGILQITGKNNYRMCSMYIFKDERLVTDPSMLLEPEYAVASACWYWLANDLKEVKDIKVATRIINGGLNGLDDRAELYDRALEIIG